MINSSYPTACTIIGVTKEHLKFVENPVKYRKELLRDEYEAKQKRLVEKLMLKKKRVAILEKLRSIEKAKFAAKNREKRVQVQLRLDRNKTIEFYRKINVETKLKRRDEKVAANFVNLKQNKAEKIRKCQLSRHWNRLNNQKFEVERHNKTLDNKSLRAYKVEDEIMKEKHRVNYNKRIEKTLEQNALDYNTPNITIANKQHVDREKEFTHVLVDRIEKFKTNLNTSELSTVFFEKTQPVWDRMTQCLVKKYSPSVSESMSKTMYVDESPKSPVKVTSTKEESSLQNILFKDMLKDINYKWSDSSIIGMVKNAKLLLGTDATAADVLHLTRCMMEDEADNYINVDFIVRSLIQRSVFEFSKIHIARRIFGHSRKSVDRLRHVNDEGLIPKNLIESKNAQAVTAVVREFIGNDAAYGRLDLPTDDEPDYDALAPDAVAERMQKVVHDGRDETKRQPLFPMEKRGDVLQVIDQRITSFLEKADSTIATFVSTIKSDKFTKARYSSSNITMMMAYRIGRKLTKLMFNLFRMEKRRVYHDVKAMNLYRDMVINRTPSVMYKNNVKKPKKVEIDIRYFLCLLENLNPRNRRNKIL